MAEKTAGLGHKHLARGAKGEKCDIAGDDATDDEGGGGEGP
jgi:hypothetical protein